MGFGLGPTCCSIGGHNLHSSKEAEAVIQVTLGYGRKRKRPKLITPSLDSISYQNYVNPDGIVSWNAPF